LNIDNEQVLELIESMDKESKAIRLEALRFSWHMRGGVTYEDAMLLSAQERELIGQIIKGHMETTKESGLPFF
jgi:hypothetical protein